MEVRQLNKLQLKVAIVDDDRNFGFWLQQQLTNLPCRVTTYVLAPVPGVHAVALRGRLRVGQVEERRLPRALCPTA